MNNVEFKFNPILEEWAKRADEVSPEEALDGLAEIYIMNCGISLGDRTVAEDAAFYWVRKWKDIDKTVDEETKTLHDVMAIRSDEYKKNWEWIDKYDVTWLEKEDRQDICLEMINDYPKHSHKIALAAGTYSSILRTLEVERELNEKK